MADDDTIRLQVMPSLAATLRTAAASSQYVPSTIAVRPVGALVVPPAFRAAAGAAPRARAQKAALDEDEYLKRMGDIIERDFYPDLPKLELQLKVSAAAVVVLRPLTRQKSIFVVCSCAHTFPSAHVFLRAAVDGCHSKQG